MLDLVIRNGTVVLPDQGTQMDIGIQHGRIVELASTGQLGDARKVIDADKLLVFPGLIDAHVHVDQPLGEFVTNDKFGDATRAAAFGGTTMIVDFAIPDPGELPLHAFERKQALARDESYVDYGFHGCVTNGEVQSLQDIPRLIERGGSSIKAFMVYKDRLMLSHGEIREVMHTIASHNGVLFIHAEDAEIIDYLIAHRLATKDTTPYTHLLARPNISELTAISMVVNLVEETGCPTYFVHMSCAEAQEVLRSARNRRLPIRAETCPHYLTLTSQVYEGPHPENFICSPPIRSERDSVALWEMIREGLIQSVNSDHCGYDTAQKSKFRNDFTKIPNGLPGVETRNLILYSEAVGKGRLAVEDFVALTSTNVARMLGVYPRKGTIAIGSDADIVIYDPDSNWTLHSTDLHMKTDYTPFEGVSIRGRPRMTIVRGEIVMQDGQLLGQPTHGQFVATAARW
ncbi:MAG TPA: dihydropyrimidinase [Ktedonobacteraceae bacterium]|nr:dihydropyrimidinase [Ktedonobacteraceae bacterium]